MTVLVMGGTRFNGLALVHELARHGHEVTVLNRGESAAVLPRQVRRLYADRHDHDALKTVFAGEIFDCAQDISAYTLDDVKGILGALEGRIGHYIFASSTVIYARASHLPITEDFAVDRSERQSAYGMNKLICEDYLLERFRAERFPVTIAPFSMVFGPHNNLIDREFRMFIRLIKGRPVLIPGDGTTLGQVGHVFDQARALRLMMQATVTWGKRYNVTGTDYFSDEGYVDTFAEVLGVTPRKVFVPPDVMNEIWGAGRPSRYLIQRLAPNIHPWNESTLFSIDRLRRDVGHEPEFTFPAAVEQTWQWFRAEGLDATMTFDFAPEDELLARLEP